LELKIDEAIQFAKKNPSRTIVEEIPNIWVHKFTFP
jgi:hypothetical protein